MMIKEKFFPTDGVVYLEGKHLKGMLQSKNRMAIVKINGDLFNFRVLIPFNFVEKLFPITNSRMFNVGFWELKL